MQKVQKNKFKLHKNGFKVSFQLLSNQSVRRYIYRLAASDKTWPSLLIDFADIRTREGES